MIAFTRGQAATEQAARNAEQAMRNADEAARNAERAIERAVQLQREGRSVPALPAAPGVPGDPRIIEVPDGNGNTMRISIGTEGISFNGAGTITEGSANRAIPSGVVDIVQALAVMVVLVVVGSPLARAWARRIDRRTALAPAAGDVSQRLASIEQAVDAVAVEVERISEGQRFTVKLLAEREPVPAVSGRTERSS